MILCVTVLLNKPLNTLTDLTKYYGKIRINILTLEPFKFLKVSILYGNKLIYEEVLHFFFKRYTVFAEKLYAENMSVLRFFDFISDEHISYVIFIYITCHPMFKKLGNEITSICYRAISVIHMLQISIFCALKMV